PCATQQSLSPRRSYLRGPAAHCDQIVAFLDAKSRLRQGRALVRIEVPSTKNVLDPVEAVLRRLEVYAEERWPGNTHERAHVAGVEERVGDRELALHPADEQVELVPGADARQHRRVLGADRVPVRAVHVGDIEVVADVPPRVPVHFL